LAEPNLTAISTVATLLSAANFQSDRRAAKRRRGLSESKSRRSFKEIQHLARFTPVVLTEGRISLRGDTEVSEVSTENA
jgi:Flp pilus assembly secretin CpaC